MPTFIRDLFQHVRDFWNNTSLTKRVIIGVLSIAVLVGFAGFLFWFNQPNYRILYSNLSPEDANRVVMSLQADKIIYQLQDGGATILVPEPLVYDLRLKIAGEGKLVGTGIGFEIFDEVKVGQTDFVQRINYQRALQGELARTISEFPNVESARVHLVVPQRSLFIEEQQKPSASVVLKLVDPNLKLDPKTVQAVLNMLTMSIEGLDKSRVSITDSNGKPLYYPEEESLTGLSNTQRDHKLRVEQGLERRISELLSPVMGPGKIIAKVNADLDFSQRTIRRELYDPEKTAIRSQQTSEETNRGRANLESGSPDTNFRGDGLGGTASTQEGSRETRATNYEINKEEQNIIAQVGDISRLTVAVVVDGTYEKNAQGEYAFVPRSQAELDRIRGLISNAVGFERARGDTIDVSCIPFGEVELPKEMSAAELVSQYAERLGKPLLNALLAFLFLMLVVRPVILALIRPKVESGEIIEGLEGLPSADEQLALYEAQEEAARQAAIEAVRPAQQPGGALEEEEDTASLHVEEVKARALQMAEHNMEQAIMVLRGWMKNEAKVAYR